MSRTTDRNPLHPTDATPRVLALAKAGDSSAMYAVKYALRNVRVVSFGDMTKADHEEAAEMCLEKALECPRRSAAERTSYLLAQMQQPKE